MPIVYDGVNGDGGGDLFQGVKFWISLRVPSRDNIVKLAVGNGGTVVRLEKDADMLIADHIKKGGVHPPPGAYSWKWVEFSVRNNALQDKEDYLIRAPEPSSGPVGSAEPRKLGRNKFTPNDDLHLVKWVQAQAAANRPTSGNVIFQEFARKHQHHTWQSWRDRWVKRYRDQYFASVPSNPSPGRNRFTAEEDQMLREYIRQAEKKGESLKGNEIYKKFAEMNPSHSFHSWRNRALRILSKEAEKDQGSVDGDAGAQGGADSYEEPQWHPRVSGPGSETGSPAIARRSPAVNGDVEVPGTAEAIIAAPPRPDPKSDDERLKRQEQSKREARAAKLLQRTWRGHALRRTQSQLEAVVVPLQSMMRGYLLRMRAFERLAEANAARNEDELVDDNEQGIEDATMAQDDVENSDEWEFYKDLTEYIEFNGVGIETKPVIKGREIDIWHLYRIAIQQDCPPEDRDWQLVAQRLGFDCDKYSGVGQEVRDCFHANLADFEETVKTYDNCEDDFDTDDQLGDGLRDEKSDVPPTWDAVTAPEEPLAGLLSPAYLSSPPSAGLKRTRDLLTSDYDYPSTGLRKRRQLDKNSVIPPTPQEKLGLARGQPHHSREQDKSSPLKSRALANGETVDTSSVGSSDDCLFEDVKDLRSLPHRKSASTKLVKPETQDRPVDADDEQAIRHSIEEDDISPSQQLQMESDACDSPEQVNSSGRTGRVYENSRKTAPTVGRGIVGGMHSRLLGSAPKSASAQAPDGPVSHANVNGKATKRTLPPQYFQKLTSTAIANPSAPSPATAPSRPTVRPGPQANPYTSMFSSGIAPICTTNGSRERVRPSSLYTPTPIQTSSRRPREFSTPAQPKLSHGQKAREIRATTHFDLDRMNAQFDHFKALRCDEGHISTAQSVACCQRGPMIVVLESLANHRGIPQDERGVWTKKDSADLKMIRNYEKRMEKGKGKAETAANSSEKAKVWMARNRLMGKHGEDGVKIRNQFVDFMDALVLADLLQAG